jgi:hypothetical protein
VDLNNPKKWYYAHFGSIPLNNREQWFSQPKLQLYGLFQALRTYKILLVGIQNLIIEVNTRYIHRMLNNPDTALSTSQNRWIISILTFHFELCHVSKKQHSPDRLLCWPPQLGNISNNIDNPKEFDNWVDNLYSFTHLLNPSNPNSKLDQLFHTFAGSCRHWKFGMRRPLPGLSDSTKNGDSNCSQQTPQNGTQLA